MAEQEGQIVKYQSRDGQELTLTFDTVQKYLVNGDREKVTAQEIMYFLGVCKSRGLNPFKKDAYLIKYGNDPAAIVTSIDYFRSRAKAQKDCKGWEKGVIVKTADGAIKRTKGLVLEGETILGGWFTAQPEGWSLPFELEVNLNGYVKKTRDGKITRFWKPENQSTMISKVAEGQGLRTLWPDEFQGLYEEAEITPGASSPIDMVSMNGQSYERASKKFEAKIPDGTDKKALSRFLDLCAETGKRSAEQVKAEAAEKPKEFWSAFGKWQEAQSKGTKEAVEAANEAETYVCTHIVDGKPCGFKAASERGLKKHITQSHSESKEAPEEASFVDPGIPEEESAANNNPKRPISRLLACPGMNGERIPASTCEDCKAKDGCPEWDPSF